MKKIQDVQHYSQLIKEIRNCGSERYMSRLYMMDQVKRLTSEGRLYYEMLDNIMLLLCDQQWFWEADFFCGSEVLHKKHYLSLQNKECVMTLYPHKNSMTDSDRELEKIAESIGFYPISKYNYYVFSIPPDARSVDSYRIKMEREGIIISQYSIEYKSEILKLWRECLESTTVSVEDIECMNNTIVAIDGNTNQICGAYMSKTQGEICSLWHLAVKPSYRKRGVGFLLTSVLLDNAFRSGFKKVYNWIAEDNISSTNLHAKYRPTFTGKIAVKYRYSNQATMPEVVSV